MAPRRVQQAELGRHSQGGRGSFYRQGVGSPAATSPAQLGTSGISAGGKDSAVTTEKQKTNPGPFSSLVGPWERHKGAC